MQWSGVILSVPSVFNVNVVMINGQWPNLVAVSVAALLSEGQYTCSSF